MFVTHKPSRPWSELAVRALAVSIVMYVVISIIDGVLVESSAAAVRLELYAMLRTWLYDFRFLFGQGVYAAIILSVGAKFFETRSIGAAGLDRGYAQD
jgi:hypothetical protein